MCGSLSAPKGMLIQTVSHIKLGLMSVSENPTYEMIYVVSEKEVDLYPTAYAYEKTNNDTGAPVRAKVLVCASTTIDVKATTKAGLKRMSSLAL